MELRQLEVALEEALAKPNDKKLCNEYSNLMAEYLNNNKSSDEIVSIVVRGFEIDGASDYYDYIENSSKNELLSIWKQIRVNKTINENANNNGLKFLSGILALAFMGAGEMKSQIGNLIAKLVSMITDEKKPIPQMVYRPILLDCFIEVILPSFKTINWNSLNLAGTVNRDFAQILLNATAGDQEDKYREMRHWANNGLRYAASLIEKENLEANIPESKVDELIVIVDHYKSVEKQLRDSIYEVHNLNKEIEHLHEEINKLNNDKSKLEDKISSLNGEINEHQKIIKKKEKEIKERKKINDAADALKKNDEQGLLNDIANELRSEYRDFSDSEKDKMDEQLGEIYREKLRNIFKILAKKGIRME